VYAVITDENDRRVSVHVRDNAGEEHTIELTVDGEVKHHTSRGYADRARNRTRTENQYNEQARRFAKYYVFRERGYETVERAKTPEFVDAVRRAIDALSPTEFEASFGELYRQLRSHDELGAPRTVELRPGAGGPGLWTRLLRTGARAIRRRLQGGKRHLTERVVTLPSRVGEDNIVYSVDVRLEPDLTTTDGLERLTRVHGVDLSEESDRPAPGTLSEADLESWQTMEGTPHADTPVDGLADVGAVSGIHVGYPNNLGKHTVDRSTATLGQEPDATVELFPTAPPSLAEFRSFLDYHLRCQVRDCYVQKGVVPPAPFQARGFGKFRSTRRYDDYDLYPEFYAGAGVEAPSF
jgi:hypothetical protein